MDESWKFVRNLGEGAYGEVKMFVNETTKQAVAVKIIDSKNDNKILMDVKKEVAVLRNIKEHANVIKFYGTRDVAEQSYLFFEYAGGGELFDRIEPDVGMLDAEAFGYFRQLLDGVEYLHSIGYTHRDIKPENLLLTENDVLKICDFGLATIFRYKGKERLLDKCCGTRPYVAPEVIVACATRTYLAQPTDVWSCGVVLVAMLAGEIPWDEPSESVPEYAAWIKHEITITPWSKMPTQLLSLFRHLLLPDPAKRYTIDRIRSHPWFLRQMNKTNDMETSPPTKRVRSAPLEDSPLRPLHNRPDPDMVSQPDLIDRSPCNGANMNHNFFSQPERLDDLVVNLASSLASQCEDDPMYRMVRRMTRFHAYSGVVDTIARLVKVADSIGCQSKKVTPTLLTLTCQDKRRNALVFKAMCYPMNNIPTASTVMIDFRLSRGDGLEFKRKFRLIKDAMDELATSGL